MFKKIKNIGSSFLGYSKKIINTKDISDIASTSSEILKKNLETLNKKSTQKESFENAQRRLGVSNDELLITHKNYIITFYIFAVFFIATVFNALMSLFLSKSFFGVITSISIGLIFLALAVQSSFRAYQIKHRVLCSFYDWKSSKEWIPSMINNDIKK